MSIFNDDRRFSKDEEVYNEWKQEMMWESRRESYEKPYEEDEEEDECTESE